MEVWEGVLGRGDGVNEGDVPDAEWLPLMKSGGCNLERGFPPRLLGVVAANWDPIILWSCEVSRKLVSTSADKRIPSELCVSDIPPSDLSVTSDIRASEDVPSNDERPTERSRLPKKLE